MLSDEIIMDHDLSCFACGSQNSDGLKLKFTVQNAGEVKTTFTPKEYLQSYYDTLHGGIQSVLLDASMVHAIRSLGYMAVTGKLEIYYNNVVTISDSVEVSAKVTRDNQDFFIAEAVLIQKGMEKTKAKGIFKKTGDILT
jgi:acyl-coenzyme A thioesterase PaaI-like protein